MNSQKKKNTLGNRKTLSIFLHAALKYKGILLISLLGITASRLFGLTAPLFYKKFFDTLGSSNIDAVSTLQHLLLIIFLLYAAENVLRRIAIFATIYFQSKTMADLQQMAEKYLMRHSYRFFSDNFSGSLVRKVTRLARSFEVIADDVLFNLIPLFVSMVVIVGVLFSKNSQLGIAMLIWVILFLSINVFFAKWKQRYDLKKAELDSKVTGFLSDVVSNSSNVQLFTANSFEDEGFSVVTNTLEKARRFTWNIDAIIDAVQVLLTIIIEIGLMFMAINLWHEGKATIGDFALIQAYLITMILQIWDFGRVLRRIYEALADSSEMVEILDTPHEIQDSLSAKPLITSGGELEFKDISFSFSKTRPILHRLSFTIKPGEHVALVGPSGAGKSTVTKLILRLYDVDHGRILIDGQNIAESTLDTLRDAVAVVPQDPILFHRTLAENIRYGKRDVSDEDVIAAAKLANCHDFIAELPDGYETFVGERGVRLSGGERQRVAIARAILKDAPILILDEATSSLDSESESLIQDALKKLIHGRTTIVIAHRLSTIMAMDRIIVIEDGGISESGTHSELLKKKGTYTRLWNIQAGGFIA